MSKMHTLYYYNRLRASTVYIIYIDENSKFSIIHKQYVVNGNIPMVYNIKYALSIVLHSVKFSQLCRRYVTAS